MVGGKKFEMNNFDKARKKSYLKKKWEIVVMVFFFFLLDQIFSGTIK